MFGAIAACCWDYTTLPVMAAEAVEIRLIEVGLAEHFQVGSWTPVVATIVSPVSDEFRLTTIAPDSDGQLVSLPGNAVRVEPGKPIKIRGRFISGRLTGDVIVRLSGTSGYHSETRLRVSSLSEPSPGETQFVLRPGLRHDSTVWGALGIPVSTFDQVFQQQQTESQVVGNDDPMPVVLSLTPEDLAPESLDWDALDVLILAANAPNSRGKSVLSRFTPEQNKALQEWIQIRGGHLILCLGSKLSEFQSTPLYDWLRPPVESEIAIRQAESLESYSPHPVKLKFQGTIPSISIKPSLSAVLARGVDGPLLIQWPQGFGRVSFLGLDAHEKPLRDWPGLGHLFAKMTRVERDQVRQIRIQGTQLAKSGTNDLSSQWFAALEEFPSVTRLSLLAVMFLMGIYILVVGPLDYLIVHRWLKRPHWTWFTFPAWIGLGTIAIAVLANSLNGTRPLSNQIDVVDVDVETGHLRGRSWVSYYSPNSTRQSVRFEANRSVAWGRNADIANSATPVHPEARMSWLAPAENRVGGLYRETGVQLSTRAYGYTAPSEEKRADELQTTFQPVAFADYPLQVWSTGRFGGDWSELVKPLVESKFSSTGFGRISGSIMHHLPEPMEDCLLAYANYVYFPVRRSRGQRSSDLPPEFTWEIGGNQPMEVRDLRGFLTQLRTLVREGRTKNTTEVTDLSTPYDSSSRDYHYILRMMTFHESAGGKDYTGLRHDLLGALDLSQHLRLGRAVLFGRIKRTSSTWTIGGDPLPEANGQTFVRFVLPVDRQQEDSIEALPKDETIKTLTK